MICIGMDVHQKSTTICIQDDTGKQVFLGSCPTTFSGFSETLRPWLEKHPGAPGMEACSKAYSTSGIVAVLGGCPQVYPADEVAKKTRSRKKKTDTRDAQDLCTNLRTGALVREVVLPPEPMRKLRSVLKARALNVKIQTQAINAAKALLREYGLDGASGSMNTQAAWKKRLDAKMPEMVRQLLETHFASFLLASNQIEGLTTMAEDLGRENHAFDGVQTIPGVGPITRLALAAHLFDIGRFRSGKQVTAYVGLCPSSYDSGDRERKGRITREGPGLLRALLVECAQHARKRKKPLNPLSPLGGEARCQQGEGGACGETVPDRACSFETFRGLFARGFGGGAGRLWGLGVCRPCVWWRRVRFQASPSVGLCPVARAPGASRPGSLRSCFAALTRPPCSCVRGL